jgi:hypothetical protein
MPVAHAAHSNRGNIFGAGVRRLKAPIAVSAEFRFATTKSRHFAFMTALWAGLYQTSRPFAPASVAWKWPALKLGPIRVW